MTAQRIIEENTTPSSLQKAIEEAIREAAEKAWDACDNWWLWTHDRILEEQPDKSTYLSQYNNQP
jgi:hypothetical protein